MDGRSGLAVVAAAAAAVGLVVVGTADRPVRPEAAPGVVTASAPAGRTAAPTPARTAAARPASPRPRPTRAVVARQALPSAASVRVAPPQREELSDVDQVARPPRPRPSSTLPPPTSTKKVVVGLDDYLFITQDWTVACQHDGEAGQVAATVAEVTKVLRDSGRPTVLAIGPNKSTVMTQEVPASGVPQRACAERSAAAYWDALTRDGGPSVMDLRAPLRQASRDEQTYWRLDTHWSPTAGTVWAQELARTFQPSLLLGLGSERGTYRLEGDLSRDLGRPETEEVSALSTTSEGVTVRTLPERSTGLRNVVRHTVTDVAPGGRVVPGRTVFVGDSFTAIAVQQLAPLFEEAVFVWAVPGDPLQPVLDELQDADRVVLESVERVGWSFRMVQPDVAPALRTLRPR